MDVEPFPQGESGPTAPWLAMALKPFAALICTTCSHIFASELPSMPDDLPHCPLCEAASWVYQALETGLLH